MSPDSAARPRRLRRGGRRLATLAVVCLGLSVCGAVPATADPDTAGERTTELCESTLRYGDSGDCVADLQRHLNDLGVNCGNELDVDGSFGPSTRMRVYAFQGLNQLDVDGIVGPDTRAKLQDPDEDLATTCPSGVEDVIRDVWPADLQDEAIRIAKCESDLTPISVGGPNTNGTLDFGVFQFNDGSTLQSYLPGSNDAEKVRSALQARPNVEAAYELYQDRGWQPWTCATSFVERHNQLKREFDAQEID